ncbi:hypothetical protein [Neisseria chenwenguii]|nr:hypothetical protein [Neisseria chenwenguii]
MRGVFYVSSKGKNPHENISPYYPYCSHAVWLLEQKTAEAPWFGVSD